jgi:hypothetical protein
MPAIVLMAAVGTAHAQCGLTFGAAAVSSVGVAPRSIAVGDFNGDGRLDMAVANQNTNNVSILLGTGAGTFTSGGTFAVGTTPFQIVAADINNDGTLDLATANNSTANCSILLGNGLGGFTPAAPVAAGTGPRGVALADLNGDGKRDLVIANSVTPSVIVCLGLGNGTFVAGVSYPLAQGANGVAVGDVNGDGVIDVIASYSGTNGVAVLRGNGDGTLAPRTTVVGIGGTAPLLTDVNNDGALDILVYNQSSSGVHIARGNGNGTFQPPTLLGVPNVSTGYIVAAADFNDDGNVDLAAPRASVNQTNVYLGDGTGGFIAGPVVSAGTGPVAAATGDFNGDGKIDLVVANSSSANVSLFLNTSSIAPRFLAQPTGGTFASDSDLTLTAAVNPLAGASLQWRLNGQPLVNGPHYSGVTTPTLNIFAFGRLEAGSYTCVATSCSSVTSNTAALTLQAPNTCGADFNNDGFVDFTDFDAFVSAFEAGC